MASTEVSLCTDYHKMMPNQTLIPGVSHVMIYSNLTVCPVPPKPFIKTTQALMDIRYCWRKKPE